VNLLARYPFLFNFPLLQRLSISWCICLKWDLELISGLPSLKELKLKFNECLPGNLRSLRVLKDTLEHVEICDSPSVEGCFTDLADFPRLQELVLKGTPVTGDIRDIGENDFPAIENLSLPDTVYGGIGYEFQSIAEVSDFISRIYPLAKQRDNKLLQGMQWRLSRESPDWYWYDGDDDQVHPPFEFELIIITGSRIGWRWKTTCCYSDDGNSLEEITSSCEINWFEPEPERESNGYENYTRRLNALQEEIDFYRGYNQPPTEEEYYRLCEEAADY
jgi:hypothetical protein